MCNAYSLTHAREEIVGLARELARQHRLELDEAGAAPDFQPRQRVLPRQPAPILRLDGAGRLVWREALWGFLTEGARPGFAPTNARDDKLETSWPWKRVARRQRCLIPADGFFEPEKPAGSKERVPWCYYALADRGLFLMGGLWNEGPHPGTGEIVESFTVVTTEAAPVIRKHDRMPALIPPDHALAWLEPGPLPGDRARLYGHPDLAFIEHTTPRAPEAPRQDELPGLI